MITLATKLSSIIKMANPMVFSHRISVAIVCTQLAFLASCGGGSSGADVAQPAQPSTQPSQPSTQAPIAGIAQPPVAGQPMTPTNIDLTCDRAPYPSITWTRCEAQNLAKTLEAPQEQLLNPEFLARVSQQSLTNTASYFDRALKDPSWLLLSLNGFNQSILGLLQNPQRLISFNLNTPVTSITSTYAGPAVSDPYRYPNVNGPDGQAFYSNEAEVAPVVFYDADCTRISGRVWRPRNAIGKLPGIVINNGSVQAHEPAYWWAAQALVRAGYVVFSYDPRGQGRSDFVSPTLDTGTNIKPSVFWLGLVDSIDFFRSNPTQLSPHNARCDAAYRTTTNTFNPFHNSIDPERLGLAGHSLGAIGVSVVQGYGAPNAAPWPGKLDQTNPVDVIVAWDGLLLPKGGLVGGVFQGGGVGDLLNRIGVADPVFRLVVERDLPKFGIRVPAMSQGSEYGVGISPFLAPPNPEQRKQLGFNAWRAAGQPVYDMTIRGSTHFEWSLFVGLPATSWCPLTTQGRCDGGFGMPTARHYTVAWFDRWLKQPQEAGFADADQRLLADNSAVGRDRLSFRYHSARSFKTRNQVSINCENIRSGNCS